MIVFMRPDCSERQALDLVEQLAAKGLESYMVKGGRQRVVEIFGDACDLERSWFERMPFVERVVDNGGPVLAANRRSGEKTRMIPLGNGETVGGEKIALIAGPCSVESEERLFRIADAVKKAGAVALRGGAFKPRTSPYTFQGHGERALEMLARARERTGLAVVTEVMRCEHVDLVAQYADVLQIGSRNMHHTHLLATVGQQKKPVLLKRGWGATLKEFLLAAEYIMLNGNENVILCERGIRTFETHVRNTLALSVVPEVKRISHLPIIVDPSHGTGRAHLVPPMSAAAVACGADGLILETHDSPKQAWTDAAQALDIAELTRLASTLDRFAQAANRRLW